MTNQKKLVVVIAIIILVATGWISQSSRFFAPKEEVVVESKKVMQEKEGDHLHEMKDISASRDNSISVSRDNSLEMRKLEGKLKELEAKIEMLSHHKSKEGMSEPYSGESGVDTITPMSEAELTEKIQIEKQSEKMAFGDTIQKLNLSLDRGDMIEEKVTFFQEQMQKAFDSSKVSQLLSVKSGVCSSELCKFEVFGKLPEGRSITRIIKENRTFGEAADVLVVPDDNGGGWTFYVSAEGQSLPIK